MLATHRRGTLLDYPGAGRGAPETPRGAPRYGCPWVGRPSVGRSASGARRRTDGRGLPDRPGAGPHASSTPARSASVRLSGVGRPRPRALGVAPSPGTPRPPWRRAASVGRPRAERLRTATPAPGREHRAPSRGSLPYGCPGVGCPGAGRSGSHRRPGGLGSPATLALSRERRAPSRGALPYGCPGVGCGPRVGRSASHRRRAVPGHPGAGPWTSDAPAGALPHACPGVGHPRAEAFGVGCPTSSTASGAPVSPTGVRHTPHRWTRVHTPPRPLSPCQAPGSPVGSAGCGASRGSSEARRSSQSSTRRS